MEVQNFSNHRRFVIGWHIVTFLAIVALLIGSIINLIHSSKENLYSASLICLIAIILGLIFVFTRTFALKVQDRAIRAEESLRHFVMTGKPLSSKLNIYQIVALRFAPDEEFVDLAAKAVQDNLSNTVIKKAIKNWRADFHRA